MNLLISHVFAGCDDLVSAVFDLGKGLCRLQLSDEEMALFSAAVLLSPGDFFNSEQQINNVILTTLKLLKEKIKTKCSGVDIFFHVDRPWLTEGQKVQKLQEKVYLALQYSLHKSVASDEKLDKVNKITTLLQEMFSHRDTLTQTYRCTSSHLTDGVQAAHNEVHL